MFSDSLPVIPVGYHPLTVLLNGCIDLFSIDSNTHPNSSNTFSIGSSVQ